MKLIKIGNSNIHGQKDKLHWREIVKIWFHVKFIVINVGVVYANNVKKDTI